MCLKKLILIGLVFYGTSPVSVFSQHLVAEGSVTDSMQKPLKFVDVVLKKNKDSIHILAYTMTDATGYYKLEKEINYGTYYLEFRSYGFTKTGKILHFSEENQTFHFNTTLTLSVETLEEINISVKSSINQHNDTTSFNLDRYRDSTEVTVEDLINKLPGMTVLEDGSIKFKNKDVKTVLLNGNDLYNGSSFAKGTKTIRADQIVDIEAIENYENNPLLQGLTSNNNIALNLKFKDGVNYSNSLGLGYLYDDRWAGQLNSVVVAPKLTSQIVIDYNTTSGKIISNFIDPLAALNWSMSDESMSTNYIQPSINEILSLTRSSLENKAFYSSLDIIPTLSKSEQLIINANFYTDQASQQIANSQVLTTGTNTEEVVENSQYTTRKPTVVNAKISYRKFLSSQQSLATKLNFTTAENSTKTYGTLNDNSYQERVNLNNSRLESNTTYTNKINPSEAFTLTLNTLYNESDEFLKLEDGIDFATNQFSLTKNNNQFVHSTKSYFELTSSYALKSKKQHKLMANAGIKYSDDNLNSQLFENNHREDLFAENTVSNRILSPMAKVSYTMKFNRFEIEPFIREELITYKLTIPSSTTFESSAKLLSNFGMKLSYLPSRLTKLGLDISHEEKLPEVNQLYDGFILRSNQSLLKNSVQYNKIIKNNIGVMYEYNNLFKDINFNFGYKYSTVNRGFFNIYSIHEFVSYQTSFSDNRNIDEHKITFNTDRFFMKLKSTIELNATSIFSTSSVALNSSDFEHIQRNTLNARLNFNTNYSTQFRTLLSVSLSKSSINSLQNYYTYSSLTSALKLFYVVNPRLRFNGDVTYHFPDLNLTNNAFSNVNFSMIYTNAKKNIHYGLSALNLLQNDRLNSVSNNDYSITRSSQQVLKRNFIFSIRINL